MHYQCNPTSKIYRLADNATEWLIYFTIVWAPWAFGTVHDWAIYVLNCGNYGIGLMSLVKFISRYSYGYSPGRWGTLSLKKKSYGHQCVKWRVRLIAILTIYTLAYVLISVLNVRASFNTDLNIFEYYESYISWLPTTYNKSATIRFFTVLVGLVCCFWGTRDWLLYKVENGHIDQIFPNGRLQKSSNNSLSVLEIPYRISKLLWLLTISGGLLAFVSIIARLDGTSKLLWILERNNFGGTLQSLGPFGYRSNGACYLNMLFPICLGFFLWGKNAKRISRVHKEKGSTGSHLLLIPIICLIMTAILISLSRAGFLILIIVTSIYVFTLWTKTRHLKSNCLYYLVSILFVSVLTLIYFDYSPIFRRFDFRSLWYETDITLPNTSEKIVLECELPSPPYEDDILLVTTANSVNPKYLTSSLSITLYKDETLRVTLKNYPAASEMSMTYTNLSKFLFDSQLKLEVSRSAKGLVTTANNQHLQGYLTKSGNATLGWSQPVIHNEVWVNLQSSLNKKDFGYEAHFLGIIPVILNHHNTTLNKESVTLFLADRLDYRLLGIMASPTRARIYKNSWKMAKDHIWFGCGLGAWSAVYFLYHDPDETWESWAHCDWLEYLISLGLLGFIPVLILLFLIFFCPETDKSISLPHSIHFGLKLAIAGCLLHAFVDFPLNVNSILHLFVILCAVKMHTKGIVTNSF